MSLTLSFSAHYLNEYGMIPNFVPKQVLLIICDNIHPNNLHKYLKKVTPHLKEKLFVMVNIPWDYGPLVMESDFSPRDLCTSGTDMLYRRLWWLKTRLWPPEAQCTYILCHKITVSAYAAAVDISLQKCYLCVSKLTGSFRRTISNSFSNGLFHCLDTTLLRQQEGKSHKETLPFYHKY